MKKLLCFLFMLLIAIPLFGSAEDSYCTIRELHDQVESEYQGVWQESVETQWRTVKIHTPLIVPDADEMPVLAFRWTKEETDFSLLPGDGWTQRSKDLYESKGLISVKRADQLPTPAGWQKWETSGTEHLYGIVDFSRVFPDYGGKTLGEIRDELTALLELLNQGRHAWDLEHPSDVMVNTATDKASKVSQTSYVHFSCYPMFEGIPVFHELGFYLQYDLPVTRDAFFPSSLSMGIGPYGEMSISYTPPAYKRLADDIPLMNLEKVQDTLRKEVEAGHIRNILEMRLGYATVNLSGDPESYTAASQAIWHVDAWWCSNGKKEIRPEDPDYPSGSYGRPEYVRIAIDAQTGEILSIAGDAAPDQKKVKRIGDYQGYLSWEEVR